MGRCRVKAETRYAYQKRIKELEERNEKLADDLYQFCTACSEIYDHLIVCFRDSVHANRGHLFEHLKQAWRVL